MARQEELRRNTAIYSAHKIRESELSAWLESVTLLSDVQEIGRVSLELASIRLVLAAAPAEVVEAHRPPETSGERQRREMVENQQRIIRSHQNEIARIETNELPGLELRLNSVPTVRDLGAWPNHPDPRAAHFKLLNEQRTERLARIEQCRAEIAACEVEIERLTRS